MAICGGKLPQTANVTNIVRMHTPRNWEPIPIDDVNSAINDTRGLSLAAAEEGRKEGREEGRRGSDRLISRSSVAHLAPAGCPPHWTCWTAAAAVAENENRVIIQPPHCMRQPTQRATHPNWRVATMAGVNEIRSAAAAAAAPEVVRVCAA